MSFGLTQIGATPHTTAYAAASGLRASPETARTFTVAAVRPVSPAADSGREQLRQQIMAERGLDMRALYGLSSQDRIRAEAAILAEVALRTGQARDRTRAEVTGLGTFIDIRA
jgi:hypothetical protein